MAPAEPGDHPLLISGDHDQVDVAPPAQGLLEFLLELVVVLADAPRQGQHINAVQAGGHRTEQLDQAMTEHVQGSNGTVMALACGLPDLTHVAAEA